MCTIGNEKEKTFKWHNFCSIVPRIIKIHHRIEMRKTTPSYFFVCVCVSILPDQNQSDMGVQNTKPMKWRKKILKSGTYPKLKKNRKKQIIIIIQKLFKEMNKKKSKNSNNIDAWNGNFTALHFFIFFPTNGFI